jgi:hypothetical protein
MSIHEIRRFIISNSFNDYFLVDSQYFIVDLDYFSNRNYQSQGVSEIIYLAGQHADKIFIFLVRDGINLTLTGWSNIVDTIVKNLNLTSNRCYLYSFENPNIPNTTFVEYDIITKWCAMTYEEIKHLPLSTSNFTKKFSALFGRHDMYRLKIAKHLYERHKKDSIISYNSHIGHWNSKLANLFLFFKEDQDWYEQNCPILLDFETAASWVPFQKSLSLIHNHYQNYFLEIVCETDTFSNKFFTEKTVKNFYLGKAFILLAGAGSLKHLHYRGFKTFDPIIDESYDSIMCPFKRLQSILQEVDRLAKFSYQELSVMANQFQEIFEHNRHIFQRQFAQ